jgi:DNA-binding CsgD family transcriptional regulator
VEDFHLRWQECLEASLKAIDLSDKVDDPAPRLRAHYCAAEALLQFGRPQEAKIHSDAMLALAERLRNQLWLARALHLAHRVSHLMGDFPAARVFSDRAVVTDPSYVSFLAWRVQMENQVGDFNQGKYYLDQLLDVLRLSKPVPLEDGSLDIVIPVVAQITGLMERLDIARITAQDILSLASATPARVQCARIGLALMATLQGDVASAAEQYAHLKSSRGQIARGSGVSIARILGITAHAMGQPDLAARHFEDSLVFCRKAGYLPELAWTCYDYATFQFERRQHQRGLVLSREALAICAKLGMRPLMERVNSLHVRGQAENAQSPAPRGPKYPAGLTERQAQILRLIAAGKSNRDIAKYLALSERTVHRHVAEIYAKIKVHNRVEATVFSLNQLDP